MEQKSPSSKEQSKEKSKKKLLAAVGKILKTKGFSALKVNDIAAVAGLDKKLIYKYFGGTDQLLDTYLSTKDFWSNVKGDRIPKDIKDGGQEFSKELVSAQFDYMFRSKEYQKIILWRLSEQRKSLQRLTTTQEEVGEVILQHITDPHFGDNADLYRAVMAILVSGVYYLNLTTDVNGSIFCGLDLNEKSGRAKIEEALHFLIDQTYAISKD
ncbi:MAG: TetR/AcrR family transcriptional regulator [Pedobacter sp.]|uniref:TetR/AcrR family transcriptional regulator n=1 Tax=Pedobacter sp. TaxID=1411316 RepID=UPI00280942C2|nr:TetR/AcrR family transcriptional regulator [Pedobacter sp.]MDQ8005412.1 TetR/AcrR family transcriptional regulator [Pedobacter sp.]